MFVWSPGGHFDPTVGAIIFNFHNRMFFLKKWQRRFYSSSLSFSFVENDDMNKTIMQNSRKLKDFQRENETLKLSLKIERERK